MKPSEHKSRGFTLVEIMVASVIGAFIAVVAVGTLRSVSAGSQMVHTTIDRAAEVRFASKRIATDLMNVCRDRNFKNMVFVGTIVTGEQGEFVSLRFFTVSRSKARLQQPEGDVYEVEYFTATQNGKSRLMRRLWPNPDKESDPGGIICAIADDIDMFDVRYFDGEEWQEEWDEDRRKMPELVEVTIAAGESQKKAVMESFFVNFARNTGQAYRDEADAWESKTGVE